MGLKERLQKIKREKPWVLPEEEKTGVINGLILIGAISSTFFSMNTHAEDTSSVSESTCETGETHNTIPANIDDWDNHCWWDHCWHDWSQWNADTSGD